MLSKLLSWLGATSADMGTQGCIVWFMDEPKVPKALIEK